MQQTLNAYSDASINELFTIIYDTVERGLGEKGDSDEDQQQQQQQDDEENMNEMLQQAQELLEEAKQSTQVQFLCFKVHE